VGELVGVKTSTAFVPPELAAVLFKPKENIDEIIVLFKSQLVKKEREKDETYAADPYGDKFDALQESCKRLWRQIVALEKDHGPADKLAGKPSFDVWSFGQVLYEVTARPPCVRCL
jgi:hypothetical protein